MCALWSEICLWNADFLVGMQKIFFEPHPQAAIFNRTPVENAGIFGVERHGYVPLIRKTSDEVDEISVSPGSLLSEHFFEDVCLSPRSCTPVIKSCLLQTITPVLGTIFSLQGLERGPLKSGQFNRYAIAYHFWKSY
jgi:hypothetical protein